MDAVGELERLVAQASREREQAERREGQARALLQRTEQARDAAARRRAGLADALAEAATLEDAARRRLGAARAEAAKTRREIEARADRAVAGGGDDKTGAAAIARSRDTLATQEELAAAHGRTVDELAGKRERAEAALAEHDRALAQEVGRELERLVIERAELADAHLALAAAEAKLVGELVDARRAVLVDGVPPRESWTLGILSGRSRFGAAQDAARAAFQALEPGLESLGPSGAGKPLAAVARTAVQSWQMGRGELAPPPDQAA